MKITYDTIPNALEIIIQDVKEIKENLLLVKPVASDEMVDRREARKMLGTQGKSLSEARFAQLKNDGKIKTYGFGGKHFYSVEELQKLKRK